MKIGRIAYLDEVTLGRLYVGDVVLRSLERPWRVARTRGGSPNVSCVPDAAYSLVRHARPNGDVCLALRNPDCGVFYSTEHLPPEGGRTLILIHSANFVEELQGCLAPGLAATIHENRHMVTASRQAMAIVMAAFDAGDQTLTIAPECGTVPLTT